jgi:flagellar biosynthesis protein FlhF
MRIKRFKARDTKTAIQMVKDELGPEAVILSTRELPDPLNGVGTSVEITAGIGYQPKGPTRPSATEKKRLAIGFQEPAPNHPTASLSNLESGMAEIKELLLDMANRSSLSDRFRDRKDLVRLYRNLIDSEVEPAIARALIEKTGTECNGSGVDPRTILRKKLARLMKVAATPTANLSTPRLIALVGTSGVGKTTTIAKLAALWSRHSQNKVALVSLDTLRLGAAEQLKTYARIMGLPVRITQDQTEFRQAVDMFQNMDMILLDTPGRTLAKPETISELAQLLDGLKQVAVMLVVSAATKDRDIAAAIRQAEALSVDSLIISKIDETQRYGNVINNLIKAKKPVSFLTNGQKVPDDIIVATPGRLAELITAAPDASH